MCIRDSHWISRHHVALHYAVTIRPVTGTIAYALYIRLPELYSHSAIHPVERKRGNMQLTYIMLVVAGGVG